MTIRRPQKRRSALFSFRILLFLVVLLTNESRAAVFWNRQSQEHHHAFKDVTTPHSHHHHHERPERGKLLEKEQIHAKDLYEAYREIQQDYQTKAFRSNKWRILNERDGVQIALLHHPSDPTCPYVRMKAIIPVSVQECWNFLRISEWDRTMPKMDPFYQGVSTFGDWNYHHGAVNMILCRKRTKRILAFGKRDLVFLSVCDEPLPDGTWVSGTVSVRTHLVPRQAGYTRAFQDSIAFYKPIDKNTKTALTIVCRIDLNDHSEDGSGGFIPMWLYVRTIGRTGAQSVMRMRDALIAEQQEQRAKQQAAMTPWWKRRVQRKDALAET